MTSLTPIRDALIAAAAEARTRIAALPPTADRLEAIGRDLSPSVLEAALIPLAEALDQGVAPAETKDLLVIALANTIRSFCAWFADDEQEMGRRYAMDLLGTLIDQTNAAFSEPATVEAFREIVGAGSEGEQ